MSVGAARMATATTTSASVASAFCADAFAIRIRRGSLPRAPDPTNAARSRLRDGIAEFSPTDLLVPPRSHEARNPIPCRPGYTA